MRKWYTVGKLNKIPNFVVLWLFPNFYIFYYEFSKNRNHHKLIEMFFERNFVPTSRNWANYIPLESYWNFQTFSCLNVFQIFHSFWIVLKILKTSFNKSWLWIIFKPQNDANDMALESYWNFTSFLCIKVFQILHNFWAVFKMSRFIQNRRIVIWYLCFNHFFK